jgi:hypothetical protein
MNYSVKKLTKDIVDYEEGQISDRRLLRLFQHLVDTGKAWTLQGHYGRMAQQLIEEGYIKRKETK